MLDFHGSSGKSQIIAIAARISIAASIACAKACACNTASVGVPCSSCQAAAAHFDAAVAQCSRCPASKARAASSSRAEAWRPSGSIIKRSQAVGTYSSRASCGLILNHLKSSSKASKKEGGQKKNKHGPVLKPVLQSLILKDAFLEVGMLRRSNATNSTRGRNTGNRSHWGITKKGPLVRFIFHRPFHDINAKKHPNSASFTLLLAMLSSVQ